ncbi:hypothetical protein ACIGW8_22320 [Streptomyces sioyaensis]|uniref:hypothetical protein n=1 Tax=Streptomyces sioyaensis TaxID=67364 RepID=UPI0037D2FC9D
MPDTFGNRHHQSRGDNGRFHSRREAQDAATYDRVPAAAGCFVVPLALLVAIIATLGVLLG